jgi:hypothetical protein
MEQNVFEDSLAISAPFRPCSSLHHGFGIETKRAIISATLLSLA